ncbi:MAG TPA: hypothetical protein VFN35_10810, partial [Ktedonobacteraceae bacterium]|nr:hypothetical protein [Ktedonobacteraceae bacterium]
GGISQRGDIYEQRAEEVANRLSMQESALDLLPSAQVLQQGSQQLQRQEAPVADTSTAPLSTPAPEGTSPPAFSPPDPATLENQKLLTEIFDTQQWFTAHATSDDESSLREDYLQRLQAERDRRLHLGQVWLAQEGNTTPATLYQIVSQGNLLLVQPISPAQAGGASPGTLVVTPEQFGGSLDKHSIPTLDQGAAASAGILGGQMQIPSFEAQLPQTFAQPANGNTLSRAWTGSVGELSFQAGQGPLSSITNLNDVPWTNAGGATQNGNFPMWDTQSSGPFGLGPDLLTQIKTSGQASQGGRENLYWGGFEDIAGGTNNGRSATFATATQNMFGSANPADIQRAIQQGQLAINADDVATFRATVTQEILSNPANYTPAFDSMLAAQPEAAGSTSYTTFAQINTDRSNGVLTEAEFNEVLSRLAQRLTTRIISNGLTTQDVINLRAARTGFGLGAASASPDVIATQAFPEWLMIQRAGGGLRGNATAMGRSAIQGAPMAGVTAVVIDGVITLVRTGDLPSLEQVGKTGITGTAGGAVGAATETAVAGQIARFGIQEGLAGGAYILVGRGLSGGAAGAIAAPVVEVGSMLLSDQEYSGEDYAARATRASVSGGIGAAGGAMAGALAAGATGALLGSEVPVVGNAVGFLVGIGIYYLSDWLIGDHVEGGVRSAFH